MRFITLLSDGPLDPERFGARAASLADLWQMQLPVMPGFAIDALACRRFLETGDLPDDMWDETVRALAVVTSESGRPPVFAVRSSSAASMPGLMDTVLNVGITEATLAALATWGDERFAAQVRFQALVDFAATVRRVPQHRIDSAVADVAKRHDPPTIAIHAAADALRHLILEETQRPVPEDLGGQLRESIEAVFASWDRTPARRFRIEHDLSHDQGTGVVVHLMAFGDRPGGAGTGVAFSRHPVSGSAVVGGAYADGTARPSSQELYPGLEALEAASEHAATQLRSYLQQIQHARRRVVRVDFAREGDDVILLEARSARLAPAGAVRAAVEMAGEGLVSEAEALLHIDPEDLQGMLHPHLGPIHVPEPVATGAAAAPGAATGPVVFSAAEAVVAAESGNPAILVLREANPDDVDGVVVAAGLLTSHGGRTSHGAVVASARGIPVVTGATPMSIDPDRNSARLGATTVTTGDHLTIDGTTGRVFDLALPVEPPVESPALDTLLGWADQHRRLQVWANADTPDVAASARAAGAEGIGLARTEYMFAGERLAVVQQIILGANPRDRSGALEELETLQIGDFERLLEAMDGRRVVVRLLDPPLNEFLPDQRDVEHDLQLAVAAGEPTEDLEQLLEILDRWQESNPMLGLRGIRLAVVIPEIYRVQVLAGLEAVRRRLDADGDPALDFVIPLVGTQEELHLIRDMIEEEVHYAGRQLEVSIGTLIELPRAALISADLALASDFFSFGTNDLTQTTYGMSRDDAEEAFLRTYLEQGILRRNPFRTIDPDGVGRLIEMAIADGRRVNPGLEIGVCGEHGSDPASIAFFHRCGVDYVSCSPPSLPIARLAAAQAALRSEG
jgi:pyruvate,orthophosphate dikinase